MTMMKTARFWLVGNNSTEQPDIELSDCDVENARGGVSIEQADSDMKIHIFIPNHNLNVAICCEKVESNDVSN